MSQQVQVKFYKGMKPAQAELGRKSDNATIPEGGIIFASGDFSQEQNKNKKSHRIYTTEDGNTVEYYKEDLEINGDKKLATTVGLSTIGTTIPNGTRLINLIKDMLFVTYVPKYSSGSVLVSISGDLSVESDSLVELGTNVSVTNPVITITGTPPSAISTLGTTNYPASGGGVSTIKITQKEGNSYKQSNGTSDLNSTEETISSIKYDVITDTLDINIDTIKINTIAPNSTTITTIGETTISYVKSSNLPAKCIVTFENGSNNLVKDTDGNNTKEVSTSNNTTKLGDGVTKDGSNDDYVTDNYAIKSKTVEKTISNKSFKVKGYLPIYSNSDIELSLGTDGETAPSTINGYNESSLFIVNGSLNTTNITTKKWNLTLATYNLETGNTNTQLIIRVTMPKKEGTLGEKIQILLPSTIEISNDYAKVKNDLSSKLSVDKATSYVCQEEASKTTYYRKISDGSFTTSINNEEANQYSEYKVWEVLNNRSEASLGSHHVLLKLIKK